MDINEHIYIWVTGTSKFESGTILDGLAFDGNFGFGSEDLREFHGQVALYASSGKVVLDTMLSTMHIARKGLVWILNSNTVPSTPFLLSSNLGLVGPVNKSINLNPTEDAMEIFSKDGSGQYPVVSEGLIGLLDHQESGDFLIAFASRKEDLNQSHWRLIFSEWESEVGEARFLRDSDEKSGSKLN